MTSTVLHILLRSAAFVGVDLVLMSGWVDLSDDPVGAGLSAFAILAVLAGVCGTVDGWFLSTSRVIVTWLVVGVVLGVAMSLDNQLGDPIDASLLLSDVVALVPLITALVAGPAIFMGAMVSQVRPPRPALPR